MTIDATLSHLYATSEVTTFNGVAEYARHLRLRRRARYRSGSG